MGSMAPPYSSSRAADRDSRSGWASVPRRSTAGIRALAEAVSADRGAIRVRDRYELLNLWVWTVRSHTPGNSSRRNTSMGFPFLGKCSQNTNADHIIPCQINLINFSLPSQCPRPMVEYTKAVPALWAQFRIDKRGRMWYSSVCKVSRLYM